MEYTLFGKIAMEEGFLEKTAKFTKKDFDADIEKKLKRLLMPVISRKSVNDTRTMASKGCQTIHPDDYLRFMNHFEKGVKGFYVLLRY